MLLQLLLRVTTTAAKRRHSPASDGEQRPSPAKLHHSSRQAMSKRVKRETVDLTAPDRPPTPTNHAAENERLHKEVAHKNEVRVCTGIWLTER